jgi:glycolate oxidase
LQKREINTFGRGAQSEEAQANCDALTQLGGGDYSGEAAAKCAESVDKQIIRELEQLLGRESVLSAPDDLLLYEYDGSVEEARPNCVVFPRTTADVSAIAKISARHGVPMVGRGAGTGLSGGALAPQGGILTVFSRMNKILRIDAENLRAVVQPGVVNLDVTRAVEHLGLYFAPDPSSQKACTIGGNVAENAGGPHTLAYGVTTNHVTGLELVLPNGDVVRVGGATCETPGYDLTGLMVGSEGTLAIVTEITVKLSRKPEAVKTLLAVFNVIEDAPETVADLTGRAITPAACEMLDGWTLRAVEEFVHAGFPLDCGAVLLIEVEGLKEAVEEQAAQIEEVCKLHHARKVRVARDTRERDLLWKGRKNAFGAVGRLSPSYYVQDAVIPRTKLPETLRKINEIGQRYGFQIGNIFHAGDGNLHPIILFDQRDPEQFRRAIAASGEIMRHCIECGGALTGEHGIGMEKNELMPLMFSDADLELMRRMRDAFNPAGWLNPGKILPLGKGCGEVRIPQSGSATVGAM